MTTTITAQGTRASVTVAGITFTQVTPGVAGNDLNVHFQAGISSTVADSSTSTFTFIVNRNEKQLNSDNVWSLWQDYDGHLKEKLIATYNGMNEDITSFSTHQFRGGSDANDLAVTLDVIDPSRNDFVAEGSLEITDTEGVDYVDVKMQGPYGRLTLDRERPDDVWAWTYTLNPADADTMRLTASTTETITITVTDNQNNKFDHDIVIAVTVRYPNVAPTLTVATGAADLTGAITEDASPDNVSGVLNFADRNADDLPASLIFSTEIASSVAKSDTTLNHDLPVDPTATMAGTAERTGAYGTFSFRRDDAAGTLTIEFDTALDATALRTAFGDITNSQLNAAFQGGPAPTTTGPAALSTTGRTYIDDLFGDGGIAVTDTLPVELL